MILGDSGTGNTRWVVSAAPPSGDEDADFSRLLSQFKEQVARNLSVEDAEAHYDLGTAYKEMGLLEEAISEFQLALRAQPTNLATFEMLGQCFLDRGEPAAAIRTLERALKVPSQVEDDLLGIYYSMARSQEEIGNAATAKDFYERIFALDINFKDVTERLRNLR
jgi:tetratricopeptide (TPR) repeat protein